jgi:hypothetical protein
VKISWAALEDMATLAGAAMEWRQVAGEVAFEAIRLACLDDAERPASSVPCPDRPGCAHKLWPKADGGYVGVSKADDGVDCDDIQVTDEEAVVWELNFVRLGRKVAESLSCDSMDAKLDLDRTRQIGSLGDGPLPILLTIQNDEDGFTKVVKQLVARFPKGFVLFAPTSRFCNVHATDLFGRVNAGFFTLEAHVILLANGKLQASKTAEELFAAHLAPPVGNTSIKRMAMQPCPRFLLRRGMGVWKLIFEGKEGEIDHGRGISLVAYLLFNPPLGGLHGTELAKRVFGQEILQEASLGADSDSTRRKIEKEAIKWNAVMKNPGASESEKAEALEELQNLADALNVTRMDSEGGADKQVRAIRRAIDRLIEKLRDAKDRKNNPHLALRALGEHLHKHLWIPSSRFSGDSRSRARAGVAGQFTYERPAGVVWAE